ncbi:hypothetical protein QMG61_04660 [Cryobacterium sp. PH31-AA6]|uniref:hypothetical protein n=1 Tax=Cryobacterium sp. PH31-AA6 TaxID=3046205 RepID=UPI0024BB0417|nr:hypothetical protein [Cryobacterium sp. PH31-AA6]MDJ0323054.1 hypothetical protein [Cryobacterium sp. PH31-AA6]
MKKVFATAATTLALAGLMLVGTAAPAQADTWGYNNCVTATVRTHSHSSWGTTHTQTQNGTGKFSSTIFVMGPVLETHYASYGYHVTSASSITSKGWLYFAANECF